MQLAAIQLHLCVRVCDCARENSAHSKLRFVLAARPFNFHLIHLLILAFVLVHSFKLLLLLLPLLDSFILPLAAGELVLARRSSGSSSSSLFAAPVTIASVVGFSFIHRA